MRLALILAVVACCHAAKLDRTYLPPTGADNAGGSPGALAAPGSRPSGHFGQAPQGVSDQGTFGTQSSGFGSSSSTFDNQGSTSFGGQSTHSAPSFRAPQSNSKYDQGTGPSNQNIAVNNQGSTSFGGQSTHSAPSFRAPQSNSKYDQGTGPSDQNFAVNNQGSTSFGGQSTHSAPSFRAPQGNAKYDQSTGPTNQNFADNNIEGQVYQPERAQAAEDRAAEILRYVNEIDGDSFTYSFETSNGITAEENGVATNGVQAQGGYSYTGDDGQVYSIQYTADENGYQPRGDHLPTPPPIPEEILRSIKENARAAAAGTQEGAYNEEESNGPEQFDKGYKYNQPQQPGTRQQYRPDAQPGASRMEYQQSGSNKPQQPARSQQQQYQANAQPNFSKTQYQQSASQPQQTFGSSKIDQSGFSSRPQNQEPESSQTQQSAGSQQYRPNIQGGNFKPQNQGNSQSFGPFNNKASRFPSPTGPSQQYGAPNSQDGSSQSQSNSGFTRNNAPAHQQNAGSHSTGHQTQRPSNQVQGYHYNNPIEDQGFAFRPSQGVQQHTGSNTQKPQYSTPDQQQSFNTRPDAQANAPSQRFNAGGSSNGPQFGRPSSPSSVTSANQYNRPNTPHTGLTASRPGGSSTASAGPTQQFRPNGQSVNSGISGSEEKYPGTPYQYNPPSVSGTGGFGPNGSGSQGQNQFGGPRQPPSFSPEEGYKY